jgi:signal transduction histidine kinase
MRSESTQSVKWVPTTVTLSTLKTRKVIEIRVSDNGTGMAEDV